MIEKTVEQLKGTWDAEQKINWYKKKLANFLRKWGPELLAINIEHMPYIASFLDDMGFKYIAYKETLVCDYLNNVIFPLVQNTNKQTLITKFEQLTQQLCEYIEKTQLTNMTHYIVSLWDLYGYNKRNKTKEAINNIIEFIVRENDEYILQTFETLQYDILPYLNLPTQEEYDEIIDNLKYLFFCRDYHIVLFDSVFGFKYEHKEEFKTVKYLYPVNITPDAHIYFLTGKMIYTDNHEQLTRKKTFIKEKHIVPIDIDAWHNGRSHILFSKQGIITSVKQLNAILPATHITYTGRGISMFYRIDNFFTGTNNPKVNENLYLRKKLSKPFAPSIQPKVLKDKLIIKKKGTEIYYKYWHKMTSEIIQDTIFTTYSEQFAPAIISNFIASLTLIPLAYRNIINTIQQQLHTPNTIDNNLITKIQDEMNLLFNLLSSDSKPVTLQLGFENNTITLHTNYQKQNLHMFKKLHGKVNELQQLWEQLLIAYENYTSNLKRYKDYYNDSIKQYNTEIQFPTTTKKTLMKLGERYQYNKNSLLDILEKMKTKLQEAIEIFYLYLYTPSAYISMITKLANETTKYHLFFVNYPDKAEKWVKSLLEAFKNTDDNNNLSIPILDKILKHKDPETDKHLYKEYAQYTNSSQTLSTQKHVLQDSFLQKPLLQQNILNIANNINQHTDYTGINPKNFFTSEYAEHLIKEITEHLHYVNDVYEDIISKNIDTTIFSNITRILQLLYYTPKYQKALTNKTLEKIIPGIAYNVALLNEVFAQYDTLLKHREQTSFNINTLSFFYNMKFDNISISAHTTTSLYKYIETIKRNSKKYKKNTTVKYDKRIDYIIERVIINKVISYLLRVLKSENIETAYMEALTNYYTKKPELTEDVGIPILSGTRMLFSNDILWHINIAPEPDLIGFTHDKYSEFPQYKNIQQLMTLPFVYISQHQKGKLTIQPNAIGYVWRYIAYSSFFNMLPITVLSVYANDIWHIVDFKTNDLTRVMRLPFTIHPKVYQFMPDEKKNSKRVYSYIVSSKIFRPVYNKESFLNIIYALAEVYASIPITQERWLIDNQKHTSIFYHTWWHHKTSQTLSINNIEKHQKELSSVLDDNVLSPFSTTIDIVEFNDLSYTASKSYNVSNTLTKNKLIVKPYLSFSQLWNILVRQESDYQYIKDILTFCLQYKAKELIAKLQPFYKEGYRHYIILTLSGVLRRKNIPYAIAKYLVKTITVAFNDEEVEDRLQALKDAYHTTMPATAGYVGSIEPELQKLIPMLNRFNMYFIKLVLAIKHLMTFDTNVIPSQYLKGYGTHVKNTLAALGVLKKYRKRYYCYREKHQTICNNLNMQGTSYYATVYEINRKALVRLYKLIWRPDLVNDNKAYQEIHELFGKLYQTYRLLQDTSTIQEVKGYETVDSLIIVDSAKDINKIKLLQDMDHLIEIFAQKCCNNGTLYQINKREENNKVERRKIIKNLIYTFSPFFFINNKWLSPSTYPPHISYTKCSFEKEESPLTLQEGKEVMVLLSHPPPN